MAKKKGPPTSVEDPILTQAEAARQLGRSRNTIRQWLQARILRGVWRPGGLLGVRQSEVNKYLGSDSTQPQPGVDDG